MCNGSLPSFERASSPSGLLCLTTDVTDKWRCCDYSLAHLTQRKQGLFSIYDLLPPWTSGSKATWGSKPHSKIIQNALSLHFSIGCPIFTVMHTKNNFMGFFNWYYAGCWKSTVHRFEARTKCSFLALGLFAQYIVVFLNVISLENSRGWQSWNTRGTCQMDGNHGLQHFLWYLHYCS